MEQYAFLPQPVKIFKLLTICCLAASPGPSALAVLDERAQTWKPYRLSASSQLKLDQLKYVVLPESATSSLRAAVADLVGLLEERLDVTLEILPAGYPKSALYFELDPKDDREGGAFTILRERTRVIIRSPDPQGWQNALYAISKHLLGARWYWAGELGFEWAEPSCTFFSNRPWREKPAFVQRRLSPLDSDFARRNRLNRVYEFNHNLAKVFGPDLFEAKPEVFATVNGRQKKPRGHGGTDPQPDFTHPDSVAIAAEAALEYFSKYPERSSFSLSINDNVLFDTTEATEAVVSPLRYFRGRPDYTDLVFGFMNRVAERVFEEGGAWQTPSGKDRFLTALAYYWTEPAPTFPVHPRVMPVLTSDRGQWHDPAYRAQDKALIRAWADSGAERLATWDYYFGAPYPYPRQFNQWIAESLRDLSDAGVDIFFSQLPSFWGLDGGKAWLASELLWDPFQASDVLLAEYYDQFFGAASEPMRRFYETAEAYRNEHEGQADWIKLYKDESSIALFSPEILLSLRDSIEEAVTLLADDPKRLARVEVVSRAFRLTELYAAMDQSRRALVTASLQADPDTEQVRALLEVAREARATYADYLDIYLKEDSYAPERRRIYLGQSNPDRLALSVLEKDEDWQLLSLTEDPELQHRGYEMRNFLGPELPRLSAWLFDYRPSERFAIGPSQYSDSGQSGLRIEGADIVSLFRSFPVVTNQAYELRLRASWQISLDNRVHLHVAWLDHTGRSLESEVPLRLPLGRQEAPVLIRIPFVAPVNAYDVRFRFVVSRQYPGDYLDISQIDFGMRL